MLFKGGKTPRYLGQAYRSPRVLALLPAQPLTARAASLRSHPAFAVFNESLFLPPALRSKNAVEMHANKRWASCGRRQTGAKPTDLRCLYMTCSGGKSGDHPPPKPYQKTNEKTTSGAQIYPRCRPYLDISDRSIFLRFGGARMTVTVY